MADPAAADPASPRYVVGIDLGTTNSVLAYAELPAEDAPADQAAPATSILPIPQLVAAGTVEALPNLPSFLYLPTEAEAGSFVLPWSGGTDGTNPPAVVGEFARRQSANVPDRVVSAAKSWLAHSRVDRRAAILPHNPAPGKAAKNDSDLPKLSPVDASRLVLAHLKAAWEHAHPAAPLAEQLVVLTVPASFDAAARELTREAALAAGLPESLILLEEPQAAVYAWREGIMRRGS